MNDPTPRSSDLQSSTAMLTTDFPFKVELSLAPLADFWTKEMPRAHPVKGVLARMVEEELRKTPELYEPIEDLAVVARHRPPLQGALRLALRGRSTGGRGPAPRRPRGPPRPARRSPVPHGAPPAGPLRDPRLHRAAGGRGDRPRGGLVAQAGPDRQGVDHLDRAVPGAAGEAPHPVPAPEAPARPRRRRRRPGPNAQLGRS